MWRPAGRHRQKALRYLGRGTHYSVLRAVVFHDPMGRSLPEGQFTDFAVIWDEDHDVRVTEPIEKIYREGLLPSFVMFGERKGLFTAILSNQLQIPFNPVFLKEVDELKLSNHSTNCLKNENIFYMGDLVQKTEGEILRIPNAGRKVLDDLKDVLARNSLRLGMSVPGWPPKNIDPVAQVTSRTTFLENKVNAICQSLDDPLTRKVVTLGSAGNPIISDDYEKVSLYLTNLDMLWQLGTGQDHDKRPTR